MSEFVNTLDVLGDEATIKAYLEDTLTEFRDDQITRIRQAAFYGRQNLVTVDLPNVKIALGEAQFSSCPLLENVNLPALKTLGSVKTSFSTSFPKPGFFDECDSLKEISLPSFAYSLDGAMFRNCINLRRVKFASLLDGANIYGQSVFSGCQSLYKLYFGYSESLGATITSRSINLSSSCIYNCKKLSTIIINIPEQFTSFSFGNVGNISTTLIPTTGFFYLPSSWIDKLKEETNWVTYASRFRAIEDYTCLLKEDTDYIAEGYQTMQPQFGFTSTEVDGTYQFETEESMVFEVGKTYMVMYDYNEYGVVATEHGLVHGNVGDDNYFHVANGLNGATNVVTVTDARSSAFGIYTS